MNFLMHFLTNFLTNFEKFSTEIFRRIFRRCLWFFGRIFLTYNLLTMRALGSEYLRSCLLIKLLKKNKSVVSKKLFLFHLFSKVFGRFDSVMDFLWSDRCKILPDLKPPVYLSFHLTPCLPSLMKIDLTSESGTQKAKNISVPAGGLQGGLWTISAGRSLLSPTVCNIILFIHIKNLQRSERKSK
jgi:hypothetical protein